MRGFPHIAGTPIVFHEKRIHIKCFLLRVIFLFFLCYHIFCVYMRRRYKPMKKIYLFISVMALILSLCACTKTETPKQEEEATVDNVKWPLSAEMNEYDEAEYWNETAGWLYYFTREKFGRSYLILKDTSTLTEDEKNTYAEALLLSAAYGPSKGTLFTENTEGTLKGDIKTVNEAIMELFGFDMNGLGTAYQKDGRYEIAGYDFDEYKPEAVTGGTGLSGSDQTVSGDISITSNGEWLASQKFELKLKQNTGGKYSKYTYDGMEITWVDPEECIGTNEAGERRDALLALTTLGKGGNAE